MAYDTGRLAQRDVIQQRVEVAQVVGEPVTLLRPLAAPEAAPVRRYDGPVLLEGVHHELKGIAGIQPPMQHEHRRCVHGGLWPPTREVHLQTAHPQFFVPRLPQRYVRRGAIQLGVVAHAETAGDQGSDEAAHESADRATHSGRASQGLRGYFGPCGFESPCVAARLRLWCWWRRRGRLVAIVSIRHWRSPGVAKVPGFHTRKMHPAARVATF